MLVNCYKQLSYGRETAQRWWKCVESAILMGWVTEVKFQVKGLRFYGPLDGEMGMTDRIATPETALTQLRRAVKLIVQRDQTRTDGTAYVDGQVNRTQREFDSIRAGESI